YEGKFPEEGDKIRYGDLVRLYHESSSRFLGTDNQNYQGGSGQTRIFTSDVDTVWRLAPLPGTDEEDGYETNEKLHSSPGVTSPVTGEQEVSAFSGGDSNDNWTIKAADDDNKDGFWRVGENIFLVHSASGHYLHSHDIQLDNDVFEVIARAEHDSNSVWSVPSN
ncbi:MIR motif-containing protein, partial [Cunninghamella echinulata]